MKLKALALAGIVLTILGSSYNLKPENTDFTALGLAIAGIVIYLIHRWVSLMIKYSLVEKTSVALYTALGLGVLISINVSVNLEAFFVQSINLLVLVTGIAVTLRYFNPIK